MTHPQKRLDPPPADSPASGDAEDPADAVSKSTRSWPPPPSRSCRTCNCWNAFSPRRPIAAGNGASNAVCERPAFRDPATLESFDWKFNEQTIDPAPVPGTGHGRVHSPPRQSGLGRRERFGKEPLDSKRGPLLLCPADIACATSPAPNCWKT